MGVATPAPRIAAVPAPLREEVVVYLVTSEEQAGLLREHVSADNDSRGRHDLVLVVGATQALVINATVLHGGLPKLRAIDRPILLRPAKSVGVMGKQLVSSP